MHFLRPQLLGAPKSAPVAVKEEENEVEIPTPHRDERQIRLDTDRSFVLYPVGEAMLELLLYGSN